LSQVYGFAKQSNGHFALYSELGSGTTAKLYLPRSTSIEILERREDAQLARRRFDPKTIILLVEDQERVRTTIGEQLRILGHQVIETSGGEEAISVLQTDQHIDLLLTDVVMPVMDGRALVKKAQEMRPDLRVLYATGYTRNAIIHNGTLDAEAELLVKPFTLDELEAAINRVLSKK
jgi:CheY-like chemotaxis protein